MRITLACITACSILISTHAFATHLRGGEITLRKIQCGAADYEVTVTLYTDTNSSLQAGDGLLSFGDGSNNILLPTLPNTVIDVRYHIGKAVYVTTHSFAKPGIYIISYNEPNRNSGIVNMKNSVDTKFYVETELRIDPSITCNNPPIFKILPIDKACPGHAFYHNPGATDSDGDSLSYELVIPKENSVTEVNSFRQPNDAIFYSGLDYTHANEAKTSTPIFRVDVVIHIARVFANAVMARRLRRVPVRT